MKFSISSYSFSQKMNTEGLTPLTAIAKAKELGFDAIEFVDFHMPSDGSKADYADSLRAECERLSLPVSNYAVGADFVCGSGGDLEAEIERVCGEVDIAVRLGAPFMRHDVARGVCPDQKTFAGFDAVLPRLVEGCRRVTAYAAERGVVTLTENHGFFAQDSRRVEKLVNAVAHPNYGLLGDMGNFLCADEQPNLAFGRIAPYIRYVHAKDFIIKDGQQPAPGEGFFRSRGGNYLRGTIVGHGMVPVRQCLQILKDAGYDGYISIEFEGMEDAYAGARIGLDNLRRYWDTL